MEQPWHSNLYLTFVWSKCASFLFAYMSISAYFPPINNRGVMQVNKNIFKSSNYDQATYSAHKNGRVGVRVAWLDNLKQSICFLHFLGCIFEPAVSLAELLYLDYRGRSIETFAKLLARVQSARSTLSQTLLHRFMEIHFASIASISVNACYLKLYVYNGRARFNCR